MVCRAQGCLKLCVQYMWHITNQYLDIIMLVEFLWRINEQERPIKSTFGISYDVVQITK